jgi:diguanylate cyclase (GGDEF)-like protein
VYDKKLSEVLREFARTLATDFPIQRILDHLVERIVDCLPITAAGVTLITEGKAPRYIAASNADALRFEQLQTEIGEGPCLASFRTGEPVLVGDLETDDRFRKFAPSAVAAGLSAVFAFPLLHDNGSLGALDLYRDVPGPLDAEDIEAAQTLADVTVAYLLNAQAREDARATSDHFRQSAMHDPLTGLPNRLLLTQRLEHAALRARRSHSRAAILFADVDRFKRVNDTHGHQIGDELLLAVAKRLAALVRPGDTLCRYAGDEFVFLCEDLHSEADAEQLANRVNEAFAAPFELLGTEVQVTASVGMAFAGPGEDISDQLVVMADTAMYQAKRKGGAAHQVIDLREASETQERQWLEVELRAALTNGDLAVAYQPIVSCAGGVVTGVEALLRWPAPARGPVSASLAVSIAEQTGMINELGQWVLERACRDHATWPRNHRGEPLDLAVNVSARQLMSADFVATVARVLARSSTDASVLILEMTEYILIEDVDRAMTVLADLKTLGIRIALDDFGTGFSSLNYLRRLPIDIVKIDQGFVADIGVAATGREIVAAVTNLAHVLGLRVIAEGIETQAQRDAVVTIGCEQAQGFYFAHPMTSAEFGGLVASFPAAAVSLPGRKRPAVALV